MRKVFVVASVLAMSGLACGSASAQDGNWKGFYLGGHGSYILGETDYANPATPSQKLQGAMVGLQGGYNWQFGRVVVGAEADVSFGSVKDFIRDGNFLTEDGQISSMGTVRARLGYSFGNFMPYVTGGFMWANLEQGTTCPAAAPFGACAVTGPFSVSVKETMTGWTAGGGAEYAISKYWSLKAEVLVGKFETQGFTATIPVAGTVTAPVDLEMTYSAKVGVNYRF